MKDNYRPRLSIVLTDEQHKSLQRLIPWGVQKQLFSIIVDDVIRLMERHGQVFVAAALSKAIKLEEYSSFKVKEKDDNN